MTLLILALLAALAAAQTKPYYPPPDSQGGWRTLKSPAEVRKTAGLDVSRLDQAFDYATRTSRHGGLLVVRHGWLAYERYYGKGHREANPAMASVGKGYTSIACGIMLRERKDRIPLGLEQKVFTEEFLPQAFPLNDAAKAEIKLGQLLAMTSGMQEGRSGMVNGETLALAARKQPDAALGQDGVALHAPLWCKPGGGYSYSSESTHVASIVLRNIVGKEMQDYIDEKLAKPMQWGRWGYARTRNGVTLPHTPGGGNIAVRSTDALRFAYLLLHKGKWNGKDLVPADYIDKCANPTPYNPHSPFTLQFESNRGGHVAGAPRDAWFKSGAGGFGIYVIPSLDMVIYKMAGDDPQYDPAATGLPLLYKYDGSRDNWKPQTKNQFSDGPVGVDDGVRRLLEMVVASVVK
ncbi:MAG: serine hydrolase [Acidobacteria bacterium]|nr:serine hydrolase [Acidobacteriota bacterium]